MNHPFEKKVQASFREFEMALPGSHVMVACSGGPDSLALLYALSSCAGALEISLSVVTIDHGLRDVSEEMALVEQHCSQLGHPWRAISVTVVPQNRSLQAGARHARLSALEAAARDVGASAIALGHTKNDRGETVLLRLLRGAGTRGLAGMGPVRHPIIRPLIGLERNEVLTYLQDQDVEWAEDPTNQSDAYTRNRLRREVLPVLEAFAPGVLDRLAKTAEIVSEDRRALEVLAGVALARVTRERGGTTLKLSCELLQKEPRALWPHIFLQALQRVRGDAVDLYAAHLEALCALAGNTDGSAAVDLPGMRVERIYDELILESAPQGALASADPVEAMMPGPGCYWNGNGLLTVERLERRSVVVGERGDEVVFDAPALTFPLALRPPVEGERMKPFGMTGTRLISDMLVDAKVPRKERKFAQVLTSAGNVLWLVGIRRAVYYPLQETTEEVIRIRYHAPKKSKGSVAFKLLLT